MSYSIHRNFFDPKRIPIYPFGKPVPSWLGDFKFGIFGEGYGTKRKLPNQFRFVAESMASLHPDQTFTTTFLQCYEKGTSVKKHRDPKSNIGYTLIGVYGEFTGAETTLYLDSGPVRFTLAPGDVLSLACTIGGVQGVPHEVSEVTSGTRYALILNTLDSVPVVTNELVDKLFE